MSLKFSGHELHLINFYEPYSQIGAANRLPTPSSLPEFAKYTYDLSSGILRHGHRRPPVINVVRYTRRNSTTGSAELVERPVYGGEWRAHAATRELHFDAGRKYWAERLGVPEDELDFFAENPRTAEEDAADEERNKLLRGGEGRTRGGKGYNRPAHSTSAKKKSRAKSKSVSHSPLKNGETSQRKRQDDDPEDPSWSPHSPSNPSRGGRPSLARRTTHRSITPHTVGPIRNTVASVIRSAPTGSKAMKPSLSLAISPSIPPSLSDLPSSSASSPYSPTWSATFSGSSDYITHPSPSFVPTPLPRHSSAATSSPDTHGSVEHDIRGPFGSSEHRCEQVGHNDVQHHSEWNPLHSETIPAHQTVVYPDGTSITPCLVAPSQYTQATSSPTIQYASPFDIPQHHGVTAMAPSPYNEALRYQYSMAIVGAPCSPITPPAPPTVPPPREDILDTNAHNLLALVYESLMSGAGDAQPIPRLQPRPPMRSWLPENIMLNRPSAPEAYPPRETQPFAAPAAAHTSSPHPPPHSQLHSPSYEHGYAATMLNPQVDWAWIPPQFSGHPHHHG